MKKVISLIITVFLLTSAMAGCTNTQSGAASEKLSIVTTIFPEYDWVREILGDIAEHAEVTMLLDNGVDLHSYQPTADDIIEISTCDLFIYVGGESDGWVEGALAQAVNEDMVVINLLDALGDSVKSEEIVDGMQHDHEHEDEEDYEHEDEEDHEHEDEEDYEHEDEEDYEHEDEEDYEHEDEEDHEHEDEEDHEHEDDEHVWLSLKNAVEICDIISEQLGAIDPDNKDTYTSNMAAYIEKLTALDEEYAQVVAQAPTTTLLFADRFPFRYLVDDYSLDYFAAFSGCSAETEASFETVTFLASKVDELNLSTILTIETGDQEIAQTVISNTSAKNQHILTMDSMQSVTSEDVQSGATYLSIMKKNLEIMKEALN